MERRICQFFYTGVYRSAKQIQNLQKLFPELPYEWEVPIAYAKIQLWLNSQKVTLQALSSHSEIEESLSLCDLFLQVRDLDQTYHLKEVPSIRPYLQVLDTIMAEKAKPIIEKHDRTVIVVGNLHA